ncbi:class I SAM-dependent methyltransferase [Yoonia sp. BS5-3]|uniref:Methyltransferase domain-containing protein n=1 Tax=Yoonia phaeophyticola TaxID=3137369 RepID=A0ABZ2VBH4_9RHOB
MADPKTIATYNAKAADYIKLVNTDGPDASLQAFIDLIPKGGAVLDLGCGPAAASAHMRAAGLLPDPVDAAQAMVDLANETYDINARLGTFDDISGVARYAGVWANFSLLHAPRAEFPRYLVAIHKALVPGGILHIGMKTGTGTHRDDIDRLYTYVGVAELTGLLQAAGFEITFTQEGREKGMAGTLDPFVLMRGWKDPDA